MTYVRRCASALRYCRHYGFVLLDVNTMQLRGKLLRQWELPDTSALPSQLEQLLLECWCLNPSARPTFHELQLRVPRLSQMYGGDGGAPGRDSYVGEARDNMDSLRSFDVTRGMRIDTEGASDEDEAMARSLGTLFPPRHVMTFVPRRCIVPFTRDVLSAVCVMCSLGFSATTTVVPTNMSPEIPLVHIQHWE